jgi:hypothetical protein
MDHIEYNDRTQSLHCHACFSAMELRRAEYQDQHRLLELREMFELDHRDCVLYGSAEAARLARRHRKEGAQRRLIGEA